MLGPTDYTLARRQMVDGQLRPNRITQPALLDAFRAVPRERFLPAAMAARAYADTDVALVPGRVLPAPMALAKLLQLAEPRAGERALVAGAGSGYGAAILAWLGLAVTAVEDDPRLRALAEAALADSAPAVRLIAGPPAEGCADSGPFDLIIIEGEVPAIPDALAGQLAAAGRIVAAARVDGRHGRAVVGQRRGGTFTVTTAFDLAMAPLPGFTTPAHFVL